MSILTFQELSQAYGATDVFTNLNGRILNDSRIGLVGQNGIGKTTLLQTLAGLEDPFGGKVITEEDLRIGYLRQEAVLAFADTQNSLYQEMLTVFDRVFAMQDEMRAIEQRMSEGTSNNADHEHYDLLLDSVDVYGGYDYQHRIERTLYGLGFDEPEQWGQSVGILSGGQKTRALLAKLILELPDLLILDEPTNHLDIQAIRWLEATLSKWRGALLIVSHDRYFLDKVINVVWEMFPTRIEEYPGNYTKYLSLRGERRERTQKEWDAMMARFKKEFALIKLRTLEDTNAKGRFRRLQREVEAVQHHGIDALRFIDKHGWMTYTQQFERKNPPQTLDEMERAILALRSPIQNDRSMRLKLASQERSGDEVLRARRLSIGYDFDHPLFTSDDIDLQRGEVVAFIGQNGAGKSTLLKTILAEIEPIKGHITLGVSLNIGYFEQAHDGLDHTNTVLEEIMRHKRGMKIPEARHYLAPYLFKGDDVFKEVSALSGGERGRLALAILSLTGANLLLLDEPTNHLDIASQEVLQDVLEDYDGTIILVSHDRYLIDALATQIWDLHEGHLRVYQGTYQDYLRQLENERAEQEAQHIAPSKPKAVEPVIDEKALKRLESQITALEAEIKELETLLAHASAAGNADTLQTLSQQYKQQQQRLAELMVEWEELATQAI